MKCPICGNYDCYHTWDQMASECRRIQDRRDREREVRKYEQYKREQEHKEGR